MTYRGWDILIESDRFDITCWITSPDGEEYPVFVAEGSDRYQALSTARRIVSLDDPTTIATLPYA